MFVFNWTSLGCKIPVTYYLLTICRYINPRLSLENRKTILWSYYLNIKQYINNYV